MVSVDEDQENNWGYEGNLGFWTQITHHHYNWPEVEMIEKGPLVEMM